MEIEALTDFKYLFKLVRSNPEEWNYREVGIFMDFIGFPDLEMPFCISLIFYILIKNMMKRKLSYKWRRFKIY